MESPSFEQNEAPPKLLFKVILMRHEKTNYTNIDHDLTVDGVEDATETGRKLKQENFFSMKNPITFLHSPRHRAKGTLDFVAEGAGLLIDNKKRPINVLRSSDVFDAEAFERHTDEELSGDPTRIAEAFYTHDIHKNHPEVIEPHLKKKERLYRAMEYLIRSVVKNDNDDRSPEPQILAVSHFEVITHLIDDVFGIENTGYRSPSFGEQVQISAFQTEDRDKILLDIVFRGLEKQVIFNRKKRSIE